MKKDRALIRWFTVLIVVGMTALTTPSRAQETPPDDYLTHRLPHVQGAVFKTHVPHGHARPVSSGVIEAATEFFEGREAAAGEVLVKFRPTTSQWVLEVPAAEEVDESEWVGGTGVLRLHSGSKDVPTLVRELSARPDVEYAEPNYIVHTTAIPNDTRFGELWGLQNTGQPILRVPGAPGADISAVPAWDISTGSRANVVAVIDTGIDYTHPDLAANVWSAPTAFTVTIGGRAITCPAGSHGFNAITNVCDPMDDNNHGSHVSGTIGAVGNNGTGVVGVNWTASIMASKFLDAAGSGTTADAINAIDFVVQAKLAFAPGDANVRVLSNSWGGGGFSRALLDEINRANASDMLFVAAAGNSSSDNDVFPEYPASYNAPNVVAVAATDNTDALASFSNFGSASVHLGAPGVNVLSTIIGGSYDYFSGTSTATPHVSGAAILILSKCALNSADLKTNILNNVDPIPSLAGLTVSGGRLNVNKAIRACSAPATPDFTLSAGPSSQTVVQGASPSYTVTVAPSGGFTGPVTFSVTGLPTGASASFSPNPATSSATMTVSTDPNTSTGSYLMTITGTSGTLTHKTSVTLVVNAAPKPDFSLSATPASQTVVRGGSTTYTANISRLGGFTAGVNFSVNGLPAGATGTFNPNPATANSSILTVTTAATTPAGSFLLTITGVSGALRRTTSVTLVVTVPPAGDFSLSASPVSQRVVRGASTSYTVAVTPSGGFAGTVSFRVTGLPTGASASFNPTPVTISGSSTMTSTMTVTTSTHTGRYPLTIIGTSGSLTRTTFVRLVITAAAAHDFSLAASPAFQNLPRGGTTSYTVRITRTGRFTAAVSLNVSGLPSGVTGGFSPNSATPNSSTLTLTAGGNASNGNFTLTITGLSGNLTRTTSVTLVVTAATLGDSSLSATPVCCPAASSPGSGSLTITYPAASTTVRATTTFRVQAEDLPSLHSVEYLLDGRKLYSAGDPVGPVTTPPYSLLWNTANVWDGDMTVKAIARDTSGNIVATSPEVPFQIANDTTRLTLLSPNPSQTLVGKANWTLQTDYPAGRPAKIFMCFVDGKLFALPFTSSQQMSFSLDTTQFQNGPHELFCALWIETSPPYPAAMSQVLVRFDNGRAPMELRTNFKELYMVPGDSVPLTAKLVYTNLQEEPAPSTFTSADPSVAIIDSSRVVKAIAPGVATIAVTSGSRSTAVRVIVNRSRIFPHFSESGQLLTTYNSRSSTFLNSVFYTDANQVINNPVLGPALKQSGVTALTSGFYYNPADGGGGIDNFLRWKPGMDGLLNNLENVASQNQLSIFLTGDDIARTDAELYDSILNPASAQRIQYVMNWAKKTGRVVGIDMIDEADGLWGDTPTPNDGRWLRLAKPIPNDGFQRLMNIINTNPRPPISFPVAGLASPTTAMNWQGNPSFSDFTTVYWTFLIDTWRHTYPWSYSLHQILANIDNLLAARLPMLQRDKPLLLLTSLAGPYYKKLGPGDQFTPGQDQLLAPGNTPEGVATQIMFAAAKGFAGVRAYGLDTFFAKSVRRISEIDSILQTFADPFQVGVQRWQAMSAAFNLIQDLRPYILQPQTHAIDLGPTVFTGAKDGPNGRLLFAINSLEVSQTIRAELTPYLYVNGSSIQRYRLAGANLASESLPSQTTDTLTLKPGEVAVWLIRPANPLDGTDN